MAEFFHKLLYAPLLILTSLCLYLFINCHLKICDPIDHPINLNECYLVVHTLISDGNVTTYVNSYTKPFLIELVSNASNDCLCCPL